IQARNKQLAEINARIKQTESSLAELDAAMRREAIQRRHSRIAEVPLMDVISELRPMARWTFDTDASDSIGKLHGTLEGRATIAHGRLLLDGKKGLMRTPLLPREIGAKTLEVWATPNSLSQRGG